MWCSKELPDISTNAKEESMGEVDAVGDGGIHLSSDKCTVD